MGNYLDTNSRSLCADVDGAPLTRTPPSQSWGRGPSPLGVAANPGPLVDVSFTASCAAPTGRVPGLRGAFITASTPCSCVGCSKSSKQCDLYYLLTRGGGGGKWRTARSAIQQKCDQVIREIPVSRGTETSAEVRVGPPGRMVSNAGLHSSGTRFTLQSLVRHPCHGCLTKDSTFLMDCGCLFESLRWAARVCTVSNE
jgi:hypothetical protein